MSAAAHSASAGGRLRPTPLHNISVVSDESLEINGKTLGLSEWASLQDASAVAGWTTASFTPLAPSQHPMIFNRRRSHRRHVLIRRRQPIPAPTADQQVPFQALESRRRKGPHGVSFQRVIGGVLHDSHGSLFPGGIEGGGSRQHRT